MNICEGDQLGIGTSVQNDNAENAIKLMVTLTRLPMRPPIDDVQKNAISSSGPSSNPANSEHRDIKNVFKIEIDGTAVKLETSEIKQENDVIIIPDSDGEEKVEVKKERILGTVDLCEDEEEIIISDDEDWFHTQNYSNNIKQELEDLKDFESDDEIICVEEQELLERWRQKICKPMVIKPEPQELGHEEPIQDRDYPNVKEIPNENRQVKILSVVSLGNLNYNNFEEESLENSPELAELHVESNLEYNQHIPHGFFDYKSVAVDDFEEKEEPCSTIPEISVPNITCVASEKISEQFSDVAKRKLDIVDDEVQIKKVKYDFQEVQTVKTLRKRSKTVSHRKAHTKEVSSTNKEAKKVAKNQGEHNFYIYKIL